ncbi:MAG TPA: glutaminyl-peptide cyclotransferase [Bacteroidales bacterium]|nr:glutaminyl-peptide cyclotransferase [Bacteroidales bacterium]
MKTDYTRFVISVSMLLILAWTFSCSGRPGSNADDGRKEAVQAETEHVQVNMVAPEENTGFKIGDVVNVKLDVDAENAPDSVVITFDSKHVATIRTIPWEYTIPSDYTKTAGRKSLKATAYSGIKQPGSVTRFMIIYSDVTPKKYGYRIVRTYSHDREAFTQGLFYYKGTLYEGTGQETGSSLREVELETGKVLRQHNLDGSLFGEGITLYGDKIFQVTWENKIGFVYDRATFNLINKIYYPTQGWGLTTIGNRIVMSDGTNVIYFYEPEMFTVVSRIEVYDDRGQVDALNELEYINGEIWANVWMTDKIVRIDPATGKVNSFVDLSGLLKNSDRKPDTDVLNGIAWDSVGNRLFVTGKRWPKLFEIKVTQ